MDKHRFGMAGYGLCLPQQLETESELMDRTGLDRETLAALGLRSRYRPSPEDQPVPMAEKAALQAFERAGTITPEMVDLVLWTGEEYKDYIAQTASIRLQEAIGCRRAWAFDLVGQGVSLLHGLRVARDIMIGDRDLQTVLLAGGTRNIDLVDQRRPETRFLLPYSASGAAMILQRGVLNNELVDVRLKADPVMADEVCVPGGGTQRPFSAENIGAPEMFFQVARPEVLGNYLDTVWPERLLDITRDLLDGIRPDYLALRHLAPACRTRVLQGLGLGDQHSASLEHAGHHGSNDVLLSLELGHRQGLIKAGDRVVLLSGGIGFNYGAALIRWG